MVKFFCIRGYRQNILLLGSKRLVFFGSKARFRIGCGTGCAAGEA